MSKLYELRSLAGEFEDVKGLDKVVEKLNKQHKWELGIHVDGASGGFVAPFV